MATTAALSLHAPSLAKATPSPSSSSLSSPCSVPFPRMAFSGKPSLHLSGNLRFSPLSIKAVSTEEKQAAVETEAPVEDVLADLKEKWDKIENKSTVFIYGGGALASIWVSSIVVGAINTVPLLPKAMELVGLGYTVWFVYRYLLFKESRKELVSDIEDIKAKIIGTGKEE